MSEKIVEIKILIMRGGRDGKQWLLIENGEILAEGYSYSNVPYEIEQALQKRASQPEAL